MYVAWRGGGECWRILSVFEWRNCLLKRACAAPAGDSEQIASGGGGVGTGRISEILSPAAPAYFFYPSKVG